LSASSLLIVEKLYRAKLILFFGARQFDRLPSVRFPTGRGSDRIHSQ